MSYARKIHHLGGTKYSLTKMVQLALIADIIFFIEGLQLFAMGLIEKYLARVGEDTKVRPLFVVEEIL